MSEPLSATTSNEQTVSTLLEDFKGRWQELLNFESEVSRWFTLYLTATIAVFGWVMGNKDFTSVQALLKEHDGLNAVLVLSLALLNAVFVLALAFDGYRIQQIGQYLYSHVGLRLTKLTGEPFNIWEDWRRFLISKSGRYGPEWVRVVYYACLGAVPVAVSFLIIGVYWKFEGKTQSWTSGHNLYAYAVTIITCFIAYASISTARQNAQWEKLIFRRLEQEEALGIMREPHGLAGAAVLEPHGAARLPAALEQSKALANVDSPPLAAPPSGVPTSQEPR
jgi:hypothetical protein